MNKPKVQQQGVALIIVLMIVAIVSVLATEMGSRLQLQIKRSSNIKDNNQAYWYAMSAEQYARKSLKDLMQDSGANTIYLDQMWNQEFVYPIEGGGIQAQLVDMQSCFNLNALRVPAGGANSQLEDRKKAFEALLDSVDGDIPTYNRDLIRDSLVDWLDDNDQPTDVGAEDSEYESRQFPYLAANNFMVHKSELRLIHGIEVQWLEKLLELVCVIPNDNLFIINVNTVSQENAAIIAAATGLSLADAKSVLSNRSLDGYAQVANFLAEPSIKALSLTKTQEDWFDVTTSYFILHTKTKYNDATFAMQSLLKIGNDKKVSVIRRDFSGF